jgi:hypothetical protein
LKGFDYTVEFIRDYDEEWYSFKHNAIIFKFNELTQENLDYLKSCNPLPLPIPESEYRQMFPYRIPEPFAHPDTGYYIYRNGSIPNWSKIRFSDGTTIDRALNFKVFIIDTGKKLGFLY